MTLAEQIAKKAAEGLKPVKPKEEEKKAEEPVKQELSVIEDKENSRMMDSFRTDDSMVDVSMSQSRIDEPKKDPAEENRMTVIPEDDNESRATEVTSKTADKTPETSAPVIKQPEAPAKAQTMIQTT